MAYSVAELDTADAARAAADLPMLVGDAGIDAFDLSPGRLADGCTVRWVDTGNLNTGSDVTDASRPTKRAFDDDPNLTTRPTGQRAADYLCCDLYTFLEPIDTVAILGHNFGALDPAAGDGLVTVTVAISNDNTFTTTQTIATWAFSVADIPVGNRRLVCTTLGDATNGADPGVDTAGVYTSVRYIRVKIAHGANARPEIGRLFLGARSQLRHQPNRTWDAEQYAASARRPSAHGVTWIREDWTNRKIVNASWRCDSVGYRALYSDWFRRIGYGVRTGLWIQTPASALAASTHLMQSDPMLVMTPAPGAYVVDVSLALREVPPFALTEWQL